MKQWTVKQGTKARLINVDDGSEQPFEVRRDMVFSKRDIVFDPVSQHELTGRVVTEYGFKSGNIKQRLKYVLVVSLLDVGVVDDEEDEDN